MTACTDDERREVARRLRELADYCDENEMSLSDDDWPGILSDYIWPEDGGYHIYDDDCRRLADLIEPSYKPDAKYEALTVIRNAVVQPVGLSRATEPRHVAEAEFDRAVMQVLCGAMALMLSGRLQAMEVDA